MKEIVFLRDYANEKHYIYFSGGFLHYDIHDFRYKHYKFSIFKDYYKNGAKIQLNIYTIEKKFVKCGLFKKKIKAVESENRIAYIKFFRNRSDNYLNLIDFNMLNMDWYKDFKELVDIVRGETKIKLQKSIEEAKEFEKHNHE